MRTFRALAAIVGVLGLAVAALWAILQSPAAKKFLARELSRRLSGPHTTVRLGTLSGWIPFEIELDTLEIADTQGVWLTVRDLSMRWHPTALLRGRLHVEWVSARQAQVVRRPASSPPSQDTASPQPLIIPDLPMPLIVDKFFLHQVTLEAPVTGMLLTTALEGSVTFDFKEHTQKARLRIVANHAQRESFLTLEAVLQPKSPRLLGVLTFFEQENGWVSSRLALKHFGTLQAEMQLRLDPSEDPLGTIWVDALRVQTRPFSLSAHGGFQTASGVVHPTSYTVVVEDFEPLGALAGVALRGHGTAEGRVEGRLGRLEGELTLRLNTLEQASWKLSNGEMRWAWTLARDSSSAMPEVVLKILAQTASFETTQTTALALKNVHVDASAQLTREGRVAIERVRLEVPDVGAAELSGIVDMPQRRAQGRGVVDFSDLSFISFLTPQPIEGDGHGQVAFSGPWDNMTVQTSLHGERFAYGEAQWSAWSLDVAGTGLPENPTGTIRCRAVYGQGSWHLDVDFAKKGTELRVPRWTFQCQDATVIGSLQTDLDTFLSNGYLDVSIPRLDMLQGLWPQKIGGNLQGRVLLSNTGGRQSIEATLTVGSGTFNDIFIEALNVSAQVKTLSPSPLGTVTVSVKELEKDPLTVAQAQVKVEGNPEGMTFSSQFQGTFHEPFTLTTTGSVRRNGSSTGIRLETLVAHAGPYDLQLEGPAQIGIDPRGWTLTPMALRVESGRVTAGAQWNAENPSASVKMENLPLSMVEFLGGPSLEGILSGNAVLHGVENNPSAMVNLKIDALRHPGWPFGETLSVEAAARADASTLHLNAVLFGLGDEPSRAKVSMPIHFQMKPLDVQMLPEGPLSGTFSLAVALERIGSLLELDEHKIQGSLKGQVNLDGSLHRPLLGGELLLTKGRYEHEDWGIVLQDVTATVKAAKDTLFLRELKAFDGKKGFLRGSGRWRLDSSALFPYQAQVTFEDVSPLHRDDISGNLNGTLTIQGNFQETTLGGTLRVRPLKVELPKRLPPNIVELDVEETPPPSKPSGSPRPKGPSESPHRLSFELAVEFPGMTTVSGWGLESEWRGAVKITGRLPHPRLTGRLDTTRGSLDFLHRRFRLAEGHVIFYGETPPNPAILVLGETAVRDMTARVRLSGRASDLELALESSPERPQEEILAQILFGRSATTLTPLQAIRLANALQALRNRGGPSRNVLGKTQDFLGLDQLKLLGTGLGEGLGIGLGKYLGENLRVDVDQRLEQGDVSLKVEVEVTPNITVETEAGTQSRTGAGVFWKYDY
ncbi:translocation/assembly module TamB domain-containing protein [Desulfosoma caldarium]|uniref:Autotransporter translocation and assembly factor TamB n=1 Tax=Desulfosoma caldarium TaxID=610254 RepID=A0A3N1UP34_9BACT|nr:translocation/assembly module TamB domain-containing protein [Desulfosoma caldarium]ROQ91159.1 autotransporter translocation and assembly factor TamB [Desulfosoma caldarium]